jgi:nucleoside-diphosphate-sugar epimerase
MPRNRVFVTGGRGFVGQVAVRRLLGLEIPVTLLTRRPDALPRDVAGRVEVVAGGLADRAAIQAALSGCASIVHCARSDDPDPGRRYETDISGTAALLDAARAVDVRRFVHVSSLSVYPIVASGHVDESTPYGHATDPYSTTKRRQEMDVLARHADFDVIVLQPSDIYGPAHLGGANNLLELMSRGRVILVNAGEGIVNLVHIEDVSAAIALAVAGRGVPGHRYVLTDGQPRPLRDYFSRLEQILGHRATVSMSADEARRYSRRVLKASIAERVVRRLVRTLTRRTPIFPLSDDAVDRYASRAVFVIDRARRELGYDPSIGLEAGLGAAAPSRSSSSGDSIPR